MSDKDKNEKNVKKPGHVIPAASNITSEFAKDFPNQVKLKKISSQDESLIKKLSKELGDMGVTDRGGNEIVGATVEEMEEMLRIAEEGARLERDLHPEFYKNFVEYTNEYSVEDNPFSDGLDDFGNKVYESDEDWNK